MQDCGIDPAIRSFAGFRNFFCFIWLYYSRLFWMSNAYGNILESEIFIFMSLNTNREPGHPMHLAAGQKST